jgi:5,10-methylenetetrahydromethanopterin reductase
VTEYSLARVEISCAFATSLDTPDHIARAEELGYTRAWCYDSPALYPDVWMTLARAAERTSRIGLGPGVLIPHLRHPMVNAAAIATLARQAPARVVAGVGSGFSGRLAMGQRPLRWADVRAYVTALRGLLRGEDVEWEGTTIRMLQAEGFGAPRPIEVPILIAAMGPKGVAVAEEVADGVFVIPVPPLETTLRWKTMLVAGTVVDEGEDPTSDRVRAAAAPFVAPLYHGTYQMDGPEAVDALPGGREWRASAEAVDEAVRHLEIHKGHLTHLNEHDEAAWSAGSWQLLGQLTLTGSPEEIRARLDALEREGVTELAYQPHGDIPRELERFAEAAGLLAAAV